MLTKDQRVSISKKIVIIPKQNKELERSAEIIGKELGTTLNEDNGNKALIDPITSLIGAYQEELSRYDGNARTSILESNIQDSAKRELNNFFFPNNTQVSTPSLPNGIWKNPIPYARNLAVGKTYQEVFTSTGKESDLIDQLNLLISQMEAYTEIVRATGQTCNGGGVCSLPIYLDSASCTSNGGTWTVGPDVISNDTNVQLLNTNIENKVTEIKNFILITKAIIQGNPDTNSTRVGQNNAAVSSIDLTISAINSWEALPDFNISHGQTTCTNFNSYNPYLLSQTKYRNDGFLILKNAISSRTSTVSSRQSQVAGYLGNVVQDISTGEITTYEGLYGDRFRILQLRIHSFTGSLPKYLNLSNSINAQQQIKDANDNALAVYANVMVCKKFLAPAGGHNKINLIDATGITVGQNGYIISDSQEEIAVTVISVSGNNIELSKKIPTKYRETENARYYSEL